MSTSEQFETEGLSVLKQSSPPRFASEMVFLVKSAEHENAHLMPVPHASFGEGFVANSGRPALRPGLDSEEYVPQADEWRFLARFDVLPDGDRPAEVVWSPDEVPQRWMDTLSQDLVLVSDKPVDHRVTVYAVVEVGKTVTVRQRVSFIPRCCCGGVICV